MTRQLDLSTPVSFALRVLADTPTTIPADQAQAATGARWDRFFLVIAAFVIIILAREAVLWLIHHRSPTDRLPDRPEATRRAAQPDSPEEPT